MQKPSDGPDHDLVRALAESVNCDRWALPPADPPPRDAIIAVIERLRTLLFPRASPPIPRSRPTLERTLAEAVRELRAMLERELEAAYASAPAGAAPPEDSPARARAVAAVNDLFRLLPEIRVTLAFDAQAAFDGDPAARSADEVIMCYPGFLALEVHRVSHALHVLGVPLVPRMMSEWAHSVTGIDIHPGAKIGKGCFIDHGTGVVIGETTVMGEFCRIYQGVTLGAKSFERDETGRMRKGYKRHPTLEDHVTVYAGATILGGDTVIGRGAVVAGSVFVTQSVPPHHLVAAPRAELRMLEQRGL